MSQRIVPINPDLNLRAYVVGLAIGDGNLSNPNGRAVRLRITCDTRYPALITKIQSALQTLLPRNRVSIVRGKGNYVNVSVYSNRLENLLGWKALGGSKQSQSIRVPEWICRDTKLCIACLRGLIETDGCIYSDRGYPMVMFSTVIPELAEQVHSMIAALGMKPRLYRVAQVPGCKKLKYHVRLSRDVAAFVDLVGPVKA